MTKNKALSQIIFQRTNPNRLFLGNLAEYILKEVQGYVLKNPALEFRSHAQTPRINLILKNFLKDLNAKEIQTIKYKMQLINKSAENDAQIQQAFDNAEKLYKQINDSEEKTEIAETSIITNHAYNILDFIFNRFDNYMETRSHFIKRNTNAVTEPNTVFSLSGPYASGKGSLNPLFLYVIARIHNLNSTLTDDEKQPLENIVKQLESQKAFSVDKKLFEKAYRLIKGDNHETIFHESADDFREIFDSHLYKLLSASSIIGRPSLNTNDSELLQHYKLSLLKHFGVLRDLKQIYKLFGSELAKFDVAQQTAKVAYKIFSEASDIMQKYDYQDSRYFDNVLYLLNKKIDRIFYDLNRIIDEYNQLRTTDETSIIELASNIALIIDQNKDIQELIDEYETIKGVISQKKCKEVFNEMIKNAKHNGSILFSENAWPVVITDYTQWATNGGADKNGFGIGVWIPAATQLERVEARRLSEGRGIPHGKVLNSRAEPLKKSFETFCAFQFPKDKTIEYTMYEHTGTKDKPLFIPMLYMSSINGEKSLTINAKYMKSLGEDLTILDEARKITIADEQGKDFRQIKEKFYNYSKDPEQTMYDKLVKMSEHGVAVEIFTGKGKISLEEYLNSHIRNIIRNREDSPSAGIGTIN